MSQRDITVVLGECIGKIPESEHVLRSRLDSIRSDAFFMPPEGHSELWRRGAEALSEFIPESALELGGWQGDVVAVWMGKPAPAARTAERTDLRQTLVSTLERAEALLGIAWPERSAAWVLARHHWIGECNYFGTVLLWKRALTLQMLSGPVVGRAGFDDADLFFAARYLPELVAKLETGHREVLSDPSPAMGFGRVERRLAFWLEDLSGRVSG